MTVRETSRKVYHEALQSGLIKSIAADVFRIILEHQPLTSAMVHKIYKDTVKMSSLRSVCPRLTELSQMGVIVEDRVDQCEVTKRGATYWKVAMQCPEHIQKPAKKVSNKEAVKILLKAFHDVLVLVDNPEAKVTRGKIKQMINQGMENINGS